MSPGSLLAGDSGINLSSDTVSRTALGGDRSHLRFIRLNIFNIYSVGCILNINKQISAHMFTVGG